MEADRGERQAVPVRTGKTTCADEVLADLGLDRSVVIHVFNKMDLVADAQGLRERVEATYAPAACVSAVRKDVGALVSLLNRIRAGNGTTGSVR
jgi:50S ribosomal subunit-associated GTPase HflX